MNAACYKILSFGYELRLLSLREQQLQHAGFHVDSVSSLDEAVTLAGREHYDLAIIGHAVSEIERNRVAAVLKTAGVPVIFLYYDSIKNAAQGNAVLSVLADPADLVAAARRLIYGASKAECG